MEVNTVPAYDINDNPTHCCPKFDPKVWDGQILHFKDKLFVKALTRSIFHIPINMGSVVPKIFDAMKNADAIDDRESIILSYDTSPWHSEHYFSATKNVPGQEMIQMNGDYMTKVFEGPYKNIPKWKKEMHVFVSSKGKKVKKIYFFYTTCPKCAKFYGKNYVVAVSEME